MIRTFALILLALASAILPFGAAQAQTEGYPNKPVKVIVPFPPCAIITLVNEKLRQTLAAPEQVKLFDTMGLNIIASTPEEFGAHLKNELDKWGRVIRERRIKGD